MKLFAILVLIATCLAVVTAQQTTLKTTTVKTTLKPTVTTPTSKPTTKTTTTSKPTTKTTTTTTSKTTTSKPTTTTTLKQTTKTTTTTTSKPTSKTITTLKPTVSTRPTTLNPSIISKYFICRDVNSTSASGTIQPDQNSTNSYCSFDIVAPSDQQIQIYCSSLNFTAVYSNNLRINGDLDNKDQLVVNRMYYSASNNLSLMYSNLNNGDSFDCKWTTVPKEITTESKLCRHAETNAANGTIQPMAGDGDSTERSCSFLIKALPDQQIQISCSAVNFTSNSYSTLLSIDGTLDDPNPTQQFPSNNQRVQVYNSWTPPVLDRVYYSSNNSLKVSSVFGKGDSFKCTWMTMPKEITTNNKLCRHSQSSAANGTIQPLASDGGASRTCYFSINVLPSQRIQISCSDLNLTTQNGNINFQGITERIPYYPGPVLNRVYYSVDNNVNVSSRFGKENSFKCNWTAIPKENTTNLQFCRHGFVSMTNGTIEPVAVSTSVAGEIRDCQFVINATSNYQIQLSCSALNLSVNEFPYSTFYITGVADGFVSPAPVSNRTYYSDNNNQIVMTARVTKKDWFSCKWTIVPKEITSDNKLCRHAVATTTNGTIQPLITAGDAGPSRSCSFVITALPDQQVQISCSNVNLTANSYLSIYGVIDNASPPIVNRVYISQSSSNQIVIYSQLSGNSTDNWFNCKWAIVPRVNTADNKLCLNEVSTSANGTIQPIAGDTGPPRWCSFSITAPLPDKKIQISCSNVSLSGNNMFNMDGTIDTNKPPVVNRVYTAYSNINIFSVLGNPDWINCKWTTTSKNTSEVKLCSDSEATSANGTIQPLAGDTGPPRNCYFSINTPKDQEVQISCTAVNLTSPNIFFEIFGAIDYANPPIVNRVYYSSTTNSKISISSRLDNGNLINCKWTTTPRKITADHKLCQHRQATTLNGTVQPIAGNKGPSRYCPFTISAPSNQQIQISCPIVNLTGPNSYFSISGVIDYASPPELNRVYSSTAINQIEINSELGNGDWMSCNWTTTPRKNTTESKFCRDEMSTSANGTIQPLIGDMGPKRLCTFTIVAPNDQQIQFSCSAVNLTSQTSRLIIFESLDFISVDPPILNRVYSSSSSKITLDSVLGAGDWVNCSWINIPMKNTTDNKLCRHAETSAANGTIQPITGDTGPERNCKFRIKPVAGQQIQISCSVVTLSSSSSLIITGIIEGYVNPPIVNMVYYSTSNIDFVTVTATIKNTDWFSCNWTTVPVGNTTNNQLCRHSVATTANGSIQSVSRQSQRTCPFSINAPLNNDQQILFSCSVVNLTTYNSYFIIYGAIDSEVNPPVVNRVYASKLRAAISINSLLGNEDTLNCNWKTVQNENTTNYKLCRHDSTVSAYGTIQPIGGDPGPSRQCGFFINLYANIQISCSTVNLVNPDSYLQIFNMYGSLNYNPPTANTIYTFPYGNIQLSSKIGDGDWFDCKWKLSP